MGIEVKGVIENTDLGKTFVNVVVNVDGKQGLQKHQVSVDKKLSRGRILAFLSAMYGVKPAEILWPGHIELKQGDIEESLAV